MTNGTGRHAALMMVAGAALLWSTGGLLMRLIGPMDQWQVVFWRSAFASLFLLGLLVWRHGWRMTRQFRRAGWPGLAIALCFTFASIALVLALNMTTVAKVVLTFSAAPLFAAALAALWLNEKPNLMGLIAIALSMVGVAVMVGQGGLSGIGAGDALALTIALAYAVAIVLMRRHPQVEMTPGVALAVVLAMLIALPLTPSLTPPAWPQLGLLFAFGALQLGLGLALFAAGARRLSASETAVIGLIEPVMGPIWVWALLSEAASTATLIGGAMVLTAVVLQARNR